MGPNLRVITQQLHYRGGVYPELYHRLQITLLHQNPLFLNHWARLFAGAGVKALVRWGR